MKIIIIDVILYHYLTANTLPVCDLTSLVTQYDLIGIERQYYRENPLERFKTCFASQQN